MILFRRLRRLFRKAARAEVFRPSPRSRFTRVYQERRWLSAETASGFGSERQSGQVVHVRAVLGRIIPELGIRSLGDLPCGDFNWMPLVLADHPGLEYRGYDVVEPLILENQRRHPEHSFAVLDITRDVPPACDLILTKDLLNHLYEKEVWSALSNLVASGSRYLMITNNTGETNLDLWSNELGLSRVLDLFAEPYSLPPALYADHYVVVWERDAVGRRLSERGR